MILFEEDCIPAIIEIYKSFGASNWITVSSPSLSLLSPSHLHDRSSSSSNRPLNLIIEIYKSFNTDLAIQILRGTFNTQFRIRQGALATDLEDLAIQILRRHCTGTDTSNKSNDGTRAYEAQRAKKSPSCHSLDSFIQSQQSGDDHRSIIFS
ncbi:hypothetical protein LXL04_030840 [Taraxacum kok-saghyz]